jgi:hypothetical protein
MQGVSRRALQWHSKCYCVASVILKAVQTIYTSRCWTTDSLYAFKYKRFRNTVVKLFLKHPLWWSLSLCSSWGRFIGWPAKPRDVLSHWASSFRDDNSWLSYPPPPGKWRNGTSTSIFYFCPSKKKIAPWPESASELYRPSDPRLSANLVSTFVGRGFHLVSVTDAYGRRASF